MSVLKAKIPGVVAVGIVCLLLGGGAGAVIVRYVDNSGPAKKDDDNPKAAADATDGGKKAAGGKGGGGKGGGGKAGGFTPSSKAQLAQLVIKLDVLTAKPLAITLTADQKKAATDLLAGLEGAEELAEDDAKKKLDDLLKAMEPHKETLEAAGYRWPGTPFGGGGGGQPPANPFKDGETAADRLKSLRSTLGK